MMEVLAVEVEAGIVVAGVAMVVAVGATVLAIEGRRWRTRTSSSRLSRGPGRLGGNISGYYSWSNGETKKHPFEISKMAAIMDDYLWENTGMPTVLEDFVRGRKTPPRFRVRVVVTRGKKRANEKLLTLLKPHAHDHPHCHCFSGC